MSRTESLHYRLVIDFIDYRQVRNCGQANIHLSKLINSYIVCLVLNLLSKKRSIILPLHVILILSAENEKNRQKNSHCNQHYLYPWPGLWSNEVSNLPWVKGRLKSVLKTVSLFTHFKFNQLFAVNYDLPKKNFFYILANVLLTLSAQIRWKLKFFRFALEWRLYEKILRSMGVVER